MLALMFGCATSSPPSEGPPTTETTSAQGTLRGASTPHPSASAQGSAEAQGAPDAGTPDASPDAGDPDASLGVEAQPAPDPKNRTQPPLDSEELQAQARALFEAIVANDAARGESFWFPKEPFIPLKDVKGPDRYWDTLHKTYVNDIAGLHRQRKSWDGATFKGFVLGSAPKWVKPGEEANKIGYHRSFRGKLRYEIEGETHAIEVRTVISWQGRWYITHLRKFKK